LQISSWINISLTFLENESNTLFHKEHRHNHNFNFKYGYSKIRVGNRNTFEVLVVKPKKEQALLIFERKIFRRIYGPNYENGESKSRTNRELEEMSKGENIVKWIKGQRISWLGHL
jgi:hypothetical protein